VGQEGLVHPFCFQQATVSQRRLDLAVHSAPVYGWVVSSTATAHAAAVRYSTPEKCCLPLYYVSHLFFFFIFYFLFTAIGLLPGGSGYFTCKQNMKLVTTRFKSGGLHEKHVVATWNLGNHLSICLYTQENQEKPVSRWPVAGPSE